MSDSVTVGDYGRLKDGTLISRFTLEDGLGTKAVIINYGGIITELHVPNSDGKSADIVLGFDNLERYLEPHPFFGALIGRFANRINKGKCTVDGQDLQLPVNKAPNHLHGGFIGCDKKVWKAAVQGKQLVMEMTLADKEEGYPGEVKIKVIYELKDRTLSIDYAAVTTKVTPVNLTNHSYFNLCGHNAGSVFENSIQLFADAYTPTDDTLIPTGEIRSVADTVYDLRCCTTLTKERLETVPTKGFDTNFCFGKSGELKKIARVSGDGRLMEVFTTQPGVQLYTGYYVNAPGGKDGMSYSQFAGLCLETQNYPDAVNHPGFPSALLKPGETYHHKTQFKFSTE